MKFKITHLVARTESWSDRKNEPYKLNNKLYIWPTGETVGENLFNRRNRPHSIWKKEVIPAIMEKLSKKYPEVYKHVAGEKWGWRQKCGCNMCSCSPGFVSKNIGQYYISVEVQFE